MIVRVWYKSSEKIKSLNPLRRRRTWRLLATVSSSDEISEKLWEVYMEKFPFAEIVVSRNRPATNPDG